MPPAKRKRAAAKPQPHDLESSLEQLRADLENLQRDVKLLAGEAGSAASEKLNEALASAMSSFESVSSRLEDWSEENLDTVRETVRAQPLQSVGIALGIGAVLGLLFAR